MPDTVLDFSSHIAEKTKNFIGREWVFKAIDNWLGDPSESRVFLLTGEPGSGRTSIAARLVEMSLGKVNADDYSFLGPGTLTYAHFCEALDDRTLSPFRFIEKLSLNLANRFEPFAQALLKIDRQEIQIISHQTIEEVHQGGEVVGVNIENLIIGNLAVPLAFDQLVRRPLEQLCVAGFEETIVILVNAVYDAMTYSAQQNIMTLIRDAVDHPQDLPTNVRFILTSLNNQLVLDMLGKPALDLIDDAPSDVDDVQAYAYRRLSVLAEPRRSELARQVAVAGQGNFLYVSYVLTNLLSNPGKMEDPRSLTLPEGLDDIYRQFLREDLGRDWDLWVDRYQALFGALAVARGQEGLTRKQLAGITGSESLVDRMLNAGTHYLAGSLPEGPFRLYHPSFREFLLYDDEYRVYPGECNQAIAKYFLDEYRDDWQNCKDEYALRYTPVHLVKAIQYTDSRRRRQPLLDALCSLLTDSGFLEARSQKVGIGTLLADLDAALELVRVEYQARPELEGSFRSLEEVILSLRKENGRNDL